MSELVQPKDLPVKIENMVITCMDHRFHAWIRKFLQEEHGIDIDRTDKLSAAGASKAVNEGDLLPQIKKAHTLHDIEKIWIFDHIDCGGFGGLQAHGNNEQKEASAHFESLDRAQEAIHAILPQIVVVKNIIGLDGLPIAQPS